MADDDASNGRKRLGAVAVEWLTKAQTRVRSDGSAYLTPLTQRRYEGAVRDFIVPFLGGAIATELTVTDVETWRDHLVASGYRAATVNGHLRVLRLVLETVKNPAARDTRALTEDDTSTTDDEPNLLTEAELSRFLAIAQEDWPQHYALILLLFSTAMRIGTALALRWEDLDEDAGLIRVRRRVSGGEILPGVKRSRRSADFPPLWPELLEALRGHRCSFTDAQVASGLVFPSEDGGLRSRTVLNKPFKSILARAGISKRLTPSSGPRRTAARLYRQVADSAVAKSVAGHLTDEMHRHYGPVGADEKTAAATKLRERIGLSATGDGPRFDAGAIGVSTAGPTSRRVVNSVVDDARHEKPMRELGTATLEKRALLPVEPTGKVPGPQVLRVPAGVTAPEGSRWNRGCDRGEPLETGGEQGGLQAKL